MGGSAEQVNFAMCGQQKVFPLNITVRVLVCFSVCLCQCVCQYACPCVSSCVRLNGTFQRGGEAMWTALTALEGGRRAQLVQGEELSD